MLKTTIKEADFTFEELNQALQLLNYRLGEGFYSYEMVESYNKEPSKILLMAFGDKELCGVFTGEIVSKESKNGVAQLIKSKSDSDLDIGILQSLAIAEDAENRGVGTLLIKKAVSVFKQRGVVKMGGHVWSLSDNRMAQILLALGFRKMAFLPNYWSKSSLERNFQCPKCGQPPCKCTAIVYTYNL